MPSAERRKAYAENTEVAAEKTKADIKKLVAGYGGQGWRSGEDEDSGQAVVEFRLPAPAPAKHWIRIRIHLPLPNLGDVAQSPTGRRRSTGTQADAYAQEIRRRWRALHLSIKAKLVAVQEGIFTIEDEFEAHIVVPGTNRTMREHTRAQLQQALETGEPIQQLRMLPPAGETL